MTLRTEIVTARGLADFKLLFPVAQGQRPVTVIASHKVGSGLKRCIGKIEFLLIKRKMHYFIQKLVWEVTDHDII